MLFLSSLAAALAPVQQGVDEGGSSETSTEESTTSSALEPNLPSSEPQLIRQQVDASQERPVIIRADLGDQLQLRVTSERPGTVELSGLGPTEDVGPDQPAHFDVLLESDGNFPVRFLEPERTEREFARIEVNDPEEPEEAALR